MPDSTEAARREMIATGQPQKDLAAMITHSCGAADGQPQCNPEGEQGACELTGPAWDTAALQRDFEVIGFAAPFVVVKRRSDGKKGTLEFTHRPRVYFGWSEDS